MFKAVKMFKAVTDFTGCNALTALTILNIFDGRKSGEGNADLVATEQGDENDRHAHQALAIRANTSTQELLAERSD